MSRVVYLHVGAPKTGTTYLQDRLLANRHSLAEHGVRSVGGVVGDALNPVTDAIRREDRIANAA